MPEHETPEDLARLHVRAFTRTRPWSAREFETLLQAPHVFAVSTPHAFALGRALLDEAELLTIASDPDHRRAGHGRAALAAFEAEARHRGATTAFLEVDAENHSATGLYRAEGYDVTATRPAYYALRDGTRADAWIMTKPLT